MLSIERQFVRTERPLYSHLVSLLENAIAKGDLPSGTRVPPERALAQQLTIVNRKGLHARASARFVRTAECFDAEVTVMRDGQTVNGNSIMGLMMLGAGPGSTILVQATGKQAREALDAITELVNSGFDEDSEGAAV